MFNAAIVYSTLPSSTFVSLAVFFFFSLVSHITISSLVRVLLAVSSQEIYWKSRGTFQKIRYTVIVLRLVKKKKDSFFFIIIANGIDTAAGRYPIRLKYD